MEQQIQTDLQEVNLQINQVTQTDSKKHILKSCIKKSSYALANDMTTHGWLLS